MEQLYTVKEAANLLKLSEKYLRTKIINGEIESIKLKTGSRRFTESQLKSIAGIH